jgi:ribosomal protein S18 acetylase RimI-like enzyme
VVSRGVRSQGIGMALMRHVQAWAKEHGIRDIELLVAEFNTSAIAWYETLGFRSQYRQMAWSDGDEHDAPGASSRDA